ncbi:hypothetical protein F4561_004841 [Lipingzhangella halophila]|uniref:Uncharacterized protein n=1 Tax=Lipingzhangella halophila TaxID=1783352 RepID=A0A7W7W4P8_9ACTN|nr:hypothetical protein [Lipingzhangella halophila]
MTEDASPSADTWRRLLSAALAGMNRAALPDTPDPPAAAALSWSSAMPPARLTALRTGPQMSSPPRRMSPWKPA